MDHYRRLNGHLSLLFGVSLLLSACGDSKPGLEESNSEDQLLSRSFGSRRAAAKPLGASPLGATVQVSTQIRNRLTTDRNVTRARFVRSRTTQIRSTTQKFDLNIFDDVQLELNRSTGQTGRNGITSWSGRVDGFVGHPANFIKSGNTLFGKIVHGDYVYVLQSVSSEIIAIQEIKRTGQAPCGNDLSYDGMPQINPRTLRHQLPITLTGTVDVMVVYTDTAKLTAGLQNAALGEVMIRLQILLGIAEMNNALARSDVRHRVRLVHTMEIDGEDVENDDSSSQLKWIKKKMNDSDDEVYGAREDYKADVVSLWVEESSNACGRGYVYDLRDDFDEWATHMVVRSCQLSKYSFLHEFGHNLGGNHDWAVSTSSEPYIYSHGYALWDVDFPMIPVRSLMAYDDICEDVGVECPRLPVFSNPQIEILGYPLGLGYADVHRTINNTGYRVSRFR